ncbi:MAG TPA: Lrp/AsnC family transcriptional regulator [Acidimicrobiales bacterium]|nr:Lrp/AsnC family transcriptional regulator [Acidimicrobiales bacterium]
MTTSVDILDARLLAALHESPRAGILELARRLGVARGTVQARLDKLVARGAVRGFGPDVDLPTIGYEVLAFTTLEIAQGRLDDVIAHLVDIPEVLEAHSISGPGDLHLRVVARTNADLQRVLNRILEVSGIGRSTTVIALSNPLPMRTIPLVRAAAQGTAGLPSSATSSTLVE